MGATASLEERAASVQPGSEAVIKLRVENSGRVVDQFELTVLGDAAAWTVVEPPVLPIFPGQSATATIHFRPPRTAGTLAGGIPFGIRVGSHEDPGGSTVEEGIITVGAFTDTAADLVPKNSRGQRSATHELALDNRGNTLVIASFSAIDPNGGLRFQFQPPEVDVNPGRAAFARLRVRPNRGFMTGPPRSHPFQLQVAPAGEKPIFIDASMIQEPLFAPWMRTAALALVGLIIAGALLWFLAIKPGIESTAKAAVKDPLAQQSAAIAQLQQKAGGGGGGQPTPTASPGPGTGSNSSTGFSRRLTVSGSPSYKVPAATTLYVTDIIFQNPNGESGQITLQRDGGALLVEDLQNFRDLDFHFVTPITANAGQTLNLSSNCSTTCTNAAVYLDGYQKPA
jgi:hypothetical protein